MPPATVRRPLLLTSGQSFEINAGAERFTSASRDDHNTNVSFCLFELV
jgi:hypothetical protein